MSGIEWLMYILFTLIVSIVCLNLLIAILSNTYDSVQASLDATNCKKKVEMLEELSNIMFWNKNNTDMVYLHVLNYANEGLNPSSDVDEWVGRVRIFVDKLDSIKQEQNVMQN